MGYSADSICVMLRVAKVDVLEILKINNVEIRNKGRPKKIK